MRDERESGEGVAGGTGATPAAPSGGSASPGDAASGSSNPVGSDLGRTVPSRPQPADASAPSGSSTPVDVKLDRTVPSRPRGADATAAPESGGCEIPGYELHELLGKGGMGEVWRATQRSLGRTVAVKLLPPQLASSEDFVARFEKEATALASLSHPHIVQIIDRGAIGAQYYFVMELVAGKNLRALLDERALEPRETFRIGAQVARALEAAHEQRIVHRDLKPENVLLDARGHVKIADFGLAGMHGNDRDVALTATSVAMGTLNYMAPEQRRDAKHVDHRADLYSLGVLLYEMATGDVPVGRFRLPSGKRAGYDGRFDRLVEELLETDVEHRLGSAREVAERLERLVTHASIALLGPGEAAVEAPEGPGAKSGPAPRGAPPAAALLPRRRSGARLLLGGAVVAVLAVAGPALEKLWTSTAAPPPPAGPPAWYEDSYGELFSAVKAEGDEVRLAFDAVDGGEGEELNVHTGHWSLAGGELLATQYGDPTSSDEGSGTVVPRAYVAHRYFSADDFDARVQLQLDELGPDFPPLEEHPQRYAELGFRIKDFQVSVFAIPGAGMRLVWRYFTADGREVVGNSSQELELVGDQTPVPKGRFRVRLTLRKEKNGATRVSAYLNERPFVRKVLEGMSGQVGKVAVGCRNLRCRFDGLVFRGEPRPRPLRRGADLQP